MRLKIAERLKDSQNTNAALTTFNEVDMSNIMAIRNKYKDAFIKKHDIKLGFMSAFLAASTQALKVCFFCVYVCLYVQIVFWTFLPLS